MHPRTKIIQTFEVQGNEVRCTANVRFEAIPDVAYLTLVEAREIWTFLMVECGYQRIK